MHFLNPPLVSYAIRYFLQMDCADPAQGDVFWELFGAGNRNAFSDRPFERLSDYEEMLRLLLRADEKRYELLHKGTAFYIMSWLAFDLHNYKKSLFYIDAGISEDVRKTEHGENPDGWKTLPGAKFLLLEPVDQVANRAIQDIRKALSSEIDHFNSVSQRPALDLDTVVRFAGTFMSGSQRTIISALYIFVMESRERFLELKFRQGSSGGSNEPFTVHLLTGGLLLESLLKSYYPKPATQKGHYTIGKVFDRPDFRADFGLATVPVSSADSLRTIYDAIGISNSVETAFSTTARLRNTTGHNLIWDDVFSDPDIFDALLQQIMNALLFVVSAKTA
jgi:hypothetical protein